MYHSIHENLGRISIIRKIPNSISSNENGIYFKKAKYSPVTVTRIEYNQVFEENLLYTDVMYLGALY